MKKSNEEAMARQRILDAVRQYAAAFHAPPGYAPGQRLPYAGRVYDHEEICNLVDSALEFWLTAGDYAARFEAALAQWLHVKHCAFVNSGSSANLLAFMALTSPLLGDRAIRPGDEVITVAAAFPTTVSPILQFGAVPVFVDVTIPQYNIDVTMLEAALSGRTKAVMAAHALGNPFDLTVVKSFCARHGLWLIEDNCDALGAEYVLAGERKFTGTFGDIGTSSFYPPHHITTGEGGAVYTDDPLLAKIIFSMRDWGRDCVCGPGQDNLCGRRHSSQYGELPFGYDHKYVYSHFGYNLKATDMQAAVGLAQLGKLASFVQARRDNFAFLKEKLAPAAEALVMPEACPGSFPSWFGFMVTCRDGVRRQDIIAHLEKKNIQTRMFFAGNITKHPCCAHLTGGKEFRVCGDLRRTDRIMNDTFWIGVFPGLTEAMLDSMAEAVIASVRR